MSLGEIIFPILIFAAIFMLISFIIKQKSKSILSNIDLKSLESIDVKVMQEPLKNASDGFYYKRAKLYFHKDFIIISIYERPFYKMNFKPFIFKNKNTDFKIGIRSEYVLYPQRIKITSLNSIIIDYQFKEIFKHGYRLTIKPELRDSMRFFDHYKIVNWC